MVYVYFEDVLIRWPLRLGSVRTHENHVDNYNSAPALLALLIFIGYFTSRQKKSNFYRLG
jgi:hypothetical protein